MLWSDSSRLVRLSRCRWYRTQGGRTAHENQSDARARQRRGAETETHDTALTLCVLSVCAASVGVLDIALAVAVALLHPVPVVHAWCFVWGLATAAMRPLAGESIHQFIERSGNFLPALALLWIECQSKPGSFEYHLMLSGVAIAGMILVSLFLRVTGLLADLPSSKGKMDQ